MKCKGGGKHLVSKLVYYKIEKFGEKGKAGKRKKAYVK
jgi:hypothetical protein